MDLTIRCPYCQHTMELRGSRPGRFGPRCPACQAKFVLQIHADPNRAPEVRPMPASSPHAESVAGVRSATIAGAANATMPEPAPSRETAAPPSKGATIAKQGAAPVTAAPRRPAPQQRPAEVTGIDATMAEVPARRPPNAGATSLQDPNADDAGADLQLGGYQVLRRLGQGGMGQVFLGRQLSLDRNVALKLLAPQLAADPQFVARFTREAYAAAQLTHHNVVQIHDIGVGRDTRANRDVHFFSMEFVEGSSLSGVVQGAGRLDPEVAAGYVLQAARGLKFAHDHGLIHRDVKPDNLLLNEHGLVKVADLGLVKVADEAEQPLNAPRATAVVNAASGGQTQLNVSMGTPAYMPPEQARDAAHVDQRADVYSLGCTLYDLLTGKPPFQGKTAYEVITKHSTEPLVPPDRVARHVPARLSAIVMKMTAKRPDDRYQTMGEVVEAIEKFLGIESGKPFSPQEQSVRELEDAVARFNGAKWASIRAWTAACFYAACGLGALLCALPQIGLPVVAAGLVGFAIVTTFFYQLIAGITQGTTLFRKFRQFLFGTRLVDWLRLLMFAGVAALLLYVFGLHWVMLGFAVAALGVAAAFHFVVDKLATAEREKPLEETDTMLRRMRLSGLDENALRQFVCKYSGDKWEAFYEALFGYDAKLVARRAWGKGDRGRDRRKHGAWRDPAIEFFERRIEARKHEKERRLLQKLEARVLTGKGVDEGKAAQEARRAADRFMRRASVIRETADQRAAQTAAPANVGAAATAAWKAPPVIAASWMHNSASLPLDDHLPGHKQEGYLKRRYGGPLDLLLGRGMRFILAAVLLAGFGTWFRQNSGEEMLSEGAKVLATTVDPVQQTSKGKDLSKAKEVVRAFDTSQRQSRPLRISAMPEKVCEAVGSWNGGLAGLILLLSCVFIGKRYALAVLLGAAVTLFGYRFPVPIPAGQAWLAAAVGAGALVLAVMFLRRTND